MSINKFLKLAAAAVLAVSAGAACAATWWNDDWSSRTKVVLDTATGAPGVKSGLKRVPVLVRLHSGNFNFIEARKDGADLRFIAADDRTPLTHHVESYDNATQMAQVWLEVPELDPGATREVWLYYGNQKAATLTNATATYDGNQVLVYHFAETGGAPRDMTANANNAAASTAQPTLDAIIGQGIRLDGTNAVRIAPSQSMNMPAAGPWTLTAWMKPAAAETGEALLFSRAGADAASGLQVGLRDGKPFVRAAGKEAVAAQPVQPAAWSHFAVVATDQVRAYLNGVEILSLPGALPALAGEAVIGSPVQGTKGFAGDLDEMGIANVARDANWIAFAATTQGPNVNFMKIVGKPETREGGGGGYLGILLGAVTLDGWIVIAILIAMFAASVWVMVTKVGYIGRVSKANEAFLEKFKHLAADLVALDNARAKGAFGKDFDESPLYRLYHTGAEEIRHRTDARTGAHGALSAQSIEAIRASLDTTLTREQQRLNRNMVLLTISISGGPFLGLLGTVVGVMITFAAIAAAGDVNVNAIAPGIAAALVATVAGLAVAIPALFAYNYLTIRIRDVTADMRVFVDELVTKMAEFHAVAPGRAQGAQA